MSEDPNIVIENELLRRGFTSIPNYIFGLPISSNAKLIYMALLSYAWTNQSCYPGLAKLCKDVSLTDKPVTKGIDELCKASLLEVKRRGLGKTNLYVIKEFKLITQSQNGSESRFGESPNPESEILRIKARKNSENGNGDSPPPKSEKRRIPNKRIEKDTAEENTLTQQRAEGVGVGSKFTVEECQRYAKHLHETGQGITNPGGYATTIYRSGEADALIEKFINLPPAAETRDTNLCPDCNGTGFWYPEGAERGVAKCRHERLVAHHQTTTLSDRRLTEEEIIEQASLIADLLGSGYEINQAEAQFGANLHPEDWIRIRERASARLERESAKVSSAN